MSVISQFAFTEFFVDALIQQCPDQEKVGACTSSLIFSFDSGSVVTICFPSPEMLINFCKHHNFPLEDQRYEK